MSDCAHTPAQRTAACAACQAGELERAREWRERRARELDDAEAMLRTLRRQNALLRDAVSRLSAEREAAG